MDATRIEHAANDLLRRMWKERFKLVNKSEVHPLDLLEPEVAAKFLGIKFEARPGLGRFGERGQQFEVAGYIHREAGLIAVSQQFPDEVLRFTGSHEIGHWVIHPDRISTHRDRPVKGLLKDGAPRPLHEQEADRFAACFLAPSKLLRKAFIARFHRAPLTVDDSVAFWLAPDDPESLFGVESESPDLALALATARSYGNKHFNSLSSLFRVSVPTMAIRIQELHLIDR